MWLATLSRPCRATTAAGTVWWPTPQSSRPPSIDVTPSGWSGSSESLVAHVVGRKAYHDDDEETAHTGAGGPQTHPSRSAAGRGHGRRRRLPGAAGVSRPTTGGGTSSAG